MVRVEKTNSNVRVVRGNIFGVLYVSPSSTLYTFHTLLRAWVRAIFARFAAQVDFAGRIRSTPQSIVARPSMVEQRCTRFLSRENHVIVKPRNSLLCTYNKRALLLHCRVIMSHERNINKGILSIITSGESGRAWTHTHTHTYIWKMNKHKIK